MTIETEDFIIDPSTSEAPPSLPEGRYGEQGEAEIVHVKRDYMKAKDDEIPYLAILVAVHHPELGRVSVGTSPFGPYNTSLKPKSRSKAIEFASHLGFPPGTPLTAAGMEALRGRKVIVDVGVRTGKAKPGEDAPLYNDLKDIYLA